METVLDRLKRLGEQSAKPDNREQAIVERHTSEMPDVGVLQKVAKGRAEMEIAARKQQRAYAEQAPPEIAAPVKEMVSNLGDRNKVLSILRTMTPEQKQEALKVAPGIAQKLGDDRGGAANRTLGAISRGISHGVSQPLQELTGMGGTPEEIDFIRNLDAAASQEFAPARPGDPWYQRGPLQAAEMAPWMATVVGGSGFGRFAATGVAGQVATKAAAGSKAAGILQKAGQAVAKAPTKVPVVGKYLPAATAGGAGELAGVTAAAFPAQYAQEVDQLKQMGMQDGPSLRLLAGGTAAVTGLIEGIVPNPFKTGPVPLTDGAVNAARQYLWQAAKNAPSEISEEYLQGVTSGLGQHVAQYLDKNAESKSISDAFKTGWDQAAEAALPMSFLLGVPAVAGASASAAQASRLARLQAIRAKGFVSAEDAAKEGIEGKSRKERLANTDAEIEQLTKTTQEGGSLPTVGQLPTNGSSQAASASPPSTPPADPATPPAATQPTATTPGTATVDRATPAAEPAEPPSKTESKTFQTASGSTYELHPDGSTTRNRAERGDGLSTGPQPRSTKTWFADNKELNRLYEQWNNPSEVTLREITDDKGEKRLSTFNTKTGQYGASIKVSDEPKPGLIPVEYWNDQTTIHYGNPIVDVTAPSDKPSTAGSSEGTGKKPTTASPTVSPDAPAKPETSMGETAGENQPSEARADDHAKIPMFGVYKTTLGGKEKFAVKEFENKGFGDSLFDTKAEATKHSEIAKRQSDDKIARQEKAKVDEDAAVKKQQEYEGSFQGFLSDTPIVKGRQLSTLGKQRSYQGKVVTVKELIERKVADGAIVNEAGQLESPDGAYLGSDKITKIGIDYARHLIASKSVPADAADSKGTVATPTGATVDRATPAAEQPTKSEGLTEGFRSLPAKGQAAFETEWKKGGTSIKNLLYPDNKNYRAEFEARTGIKLPNRVGTTFQAVEDWHNAGRPLAPNTASGSTAPQPESKWHTEARSKLEAVPAFKGAKIEPDEKTGTVRVTRQDGLATTIHLDADEKLAEAAKKIGRKQLYGLYFRKNGETEGRIYIHSKANHSNILNHEVMHWLEDQGVVTKEEVAQHGGQEAIAEKYGKWASLKQRKKDTVLQKIYDALEPVFSSQARFFEEVGNRQKATSQEDESARIAKLRADAAKAMLRGDTEMADALNRQANDLEKEPQTQENLSEDKKPSAEDEPKKPFLPKTPYGMGIMLRDRVVANVQEMYDTKNYSEDGLLATIKRAVESEFGKLTTEAVHSDQMTDDVRDWINNFNADKFAGSVRAYLGRQESKPSADQVNVDSGAESKVKPESDVKNFTQESPSLTKLPWVDSSPGDESKWYGTRVSVAPANRREEAYSGQVVRVLNRGEMVEVQPDGQDGTFRVDSSRITLEEGQPQSVVLEEELGKEPWQMTFDEYRESRLKYADENGMTREEYQESYPDDVLRADYNRNVQDPPRNADIRLEVYDQLPTSIQQRWRKFLFDLDDRLNKRDSENFEKENKPYADAQKYIEQKLADYEKMRKEKSSQEFTAQESKDVSTLEFLRGKLISVRATKEDKDAVISQLNRRKDFGTSEQKQVASPLPWRDSSPEDESKWYGTKVNVATSNRREEPYSGQVVRVLNRGEMVEVQPDGQDGTFRVDSSRISLVEESAPIADKKPDEPVAEPLPEPVIPKFTRTTFDKGSTTRQFQAERVEKAKAEIADLERKARAKRGEHDGLRSNATKKRAAVRKDIEFLNRRIGVVQGEIASDMAADTLAKLEDELESPRSYDHYLAGMKAIHKLKAGVAEDAARRGEMGREAARTEVAKEEREADRFDAELQGRAKAIAKSKGFTSGDAEQIALAASNGFTVFEDRSLADVVDVQAKRTRESRVSQEINKLKPESSYGRQPDLNAEQIEEFTKQYQEASLDDKNWLAKRLVVDTAVKDAINANREALRKREDDERKVKEAERAKDEQEALANARERAKKYFLDERISKALKKQKPKTKPVKVRQESVGGPAKIVEGKTVDGDISGELYPNGLILHKTFEEGSNDFGLTHARSGLGFPFSAKKSAMQELIGLLDILGIDFNVDTDEKGQLLSELVSRVKQINTAWDNGDYSMLSEQDYATVQALAEVAKTDIDADLILTADDLGANGIPPGLDNVMTDNGLRIVKDLAIAVPEFAYDPVFTVKDGKLLYRDGFEFKLEPTAFNLHPSELKEGQTVGINLEDLGIKRSAPQDVVAEMMKQAGLPRVTKTKGGSVSVGYVGARPTTLQQGESDNDWTVVGGTPKVQEMAVAVLKKIRWRQPGQDGEPKTDIDAVPEKEQTNDNQSEPAPKIDPFNERSPESAERRKLIAEAKDEMRPYYQIDPEVSVDEGIRNAVDSFVAGTPDSARITGGADGKALVFDGSTKQWNAIVKRAQAIADKTNAVHAVVAVGDIETGIPAHAVIISSPGFVGSTFESQNSKPWFWGNTIESLYPELPTSIVVPKNPQATDDVVVNNADRIQEIDKELESLQSQYERKMAAQGKSVMVPPSINGDALSQITKKMDKLDAEKKSLQEAKAAANPLAPLAQLDLDEDATDFIKGLLDQKGTRPSPDEAFRRYQSNTGVTTGREPSSSIVTAERFAELYDIFSTGRDKARSEAKYGNTPIGKLFAEAKAAGGDTMLFFRMGDFYELYFEDAQKAAKMLGLTLTTRDKSAENPIPMTGFPYHQLDGYLKKLKSAGIRVAVNEEPFAKPQAKAEAEQKTEPESASVPTQAEFMEMSNGVNAPGVKQTIRVTAGERTLLMERSKHDGEWSIREAEKYTGEVKGKTAVKKGGELIVSGIVETKKAKEIAQRIIDGTFDKDADKRFVREDTQSIGLTNAGIAESMKDTLGGRRDNFAKLLREDGLVTDGRFLMKVSDKDRDAILKSVGPTFEGKDLKAVTKMMDDGKKALSRQANAMKPIGYRGGYLTPRIVVLQSQDGEAAILDKKLHDTILKKYPKAVPYFMEDGKPISYAIDGDVIAIVMPMNMDKPDSKVKDLVAGKYDFEAEAAEAAKFPPPQSKSKLKQAAEKANKALADAVDEFGNEGDGVITPSMKDPTRQSRTSRRRTPGEAPGVAAADIQRTVERMFDVTVRQGGFSERAAGIYKWMTRSAKSPPSPEVVRTKEDQYASLATLAHEVAHHIDETIKVVRSMPATVATEVRTLDYEPAKARAFEGWAEFFRRYVTEPPIDVNGEMMPNTIADAPQTTEWFEETFLPTHPELAKNIGKFQEYAQRWANQSVFERIGTMIADRKPHDLEYKERWKQKGKRWVNRLKTNFLDKFHTLKWIQEEAKAKGHKGVGIYDLTMAYFMSATSHATIAFEEGVRSLRTGEQIGSTKLWEISRHLENDGEYDEAVRYALARHTLYMDEVKPGFNTGIDVDDAQAWIDEAESLGKADRYDSFAKELAQFNDDLLKMLVDAGALSAEEAGKMIDYYQDDTGSPYYFPLHRVSDLEKSEFAGTSAGFVNLGNPIRGRSREGSGRQILDPIDATVTRAIKFYGRAIQARQAHTLAKTLDPKLGGVGGMGGLMDRVPANRIVHQGTIEEILNTLVDSGTIEADQARAMRIAARILDPANGGMASDKDLDWFAQKHQITNWQNNWSDMEDAAKTEPDALAVISLWRPDYTPKAHKRTVMIYDANGNKLMYQMDDDLYQVATGMQEIQFNGFMNILRESARYFKSGAVGLSTGFGTANLIRDYWEFQGKANHVKGLNTLGKPMEMLGRYVAEKTKKAVGMPSNDLLIRLYEESGGKVYSVVGHDAEGRSIYRRRKIGKSTMAKLGLSITRPMDTASSVLNTMQEMIAISDAPPRMADAEAALANYGFVIRNGSWFDTHSQQAVDALPEEARIAAAVAMSEATINFKRIGAAGQYVEAFFPFFNATIQATYRQYQQIQNLKSIGKGTPEGDRALRTMVYLAALASVGVVYWLLRHDDDDWRNQDAWLRDGYWTWGANGKTYFRIPKPRDFAVVGNIAENMLDAWYHKDARETSDILLRELGGRIPSGGGLLRGAVETYIADYDYFRGRELEGEAVKDIPKQYRTSSYTSRMSDYLGQKFGRLLNTSPIQFQHLLNSASGGMYGRLTDTYDAAQDGRIGWEHVPFVRALMMDRHQTRTIGEFYEKKADLEEIAAVQKIENGEPSLEVASKMSQFDWIAEVMTALRKSEAKLGKKRTFENEKYITGLARAALGYDEQKANPNPLTAKDLPEDIREIVNTYRQLAVVGAAERLSPRSAYKSDDAYASRQAELQKAESKFNSLNMSLQESKQALVDYWKKQGWKTRKDNGELVDALLTRYRKLDQLFKDK